MHLQPLAADFWSLLHTAVFTGLNIRWCTSITAHFYHYLDPLSAGVLPSLYTVISNWIYFQLLYYLPLLDITIHCQLVYCKYCTLLSSMDPLSAGVHHHCTLQFTYQLLYWHYGTLLSSHGFTISWCNAITAQFYHRLYPLLSLHNIIFSWIHYQLVHCHYCTTGFSSGISGGVKTQ